MVEEIKPVLTPKGVITLIIPTKTEESHVRRLVSSIAKTFPNIQIFAQVGNHYSESTCIDDSPHHVGSAVELTVLVALDGYFIEGRPPILNQLVNHCQRIGGGGRVTAIWNGNVYHT